MRVYLDSFGNEVTLTRDYAQRTLRLHLPDMHVSRYLVVNLGWVEVCLDSQVVLVRCRPSKLSGSTLAALLYFVSEHAERSIQLDSFGTDWTRRSFGSSQAFASFIGALCPAAENPDIWGNRRFLRRPASATATRFSSHINRVQILADNLSDPHAVVRLLERLLPARWSLVHFEPDNSTSHVLAMSNEFCRFDPQWHAAGRGASIKEFGDRDYGIWIANYHGQIAERMEPSYDHVDAAINLPKLGSMRLRYQCLTYPVRKRDGSRILVCGAIDDSSVDLRQAVN